jgi:hypothetical protein
MSFPTPDPSRSPTLRVALPVTFAILLLLVAPGLNGPANPSPTRFIIELPAVDLPAHADHHAAPQPAPVPVAIPADGWLSGFRVEVVDRTGEAVPQLVLHHVQLFDPSKRDLFAPYMLRVIGAGGETGGGSIPWPFGYQVHAGDTLLAAAMLHNPTATGYEGVQVRVVLEYAGWSLLGRRAIHPIFSHVTDPSEGSSYDLPPGVSERSWDVTPAIPGRILGLGGHLHRYGVELRFEQVDTGELLWRAGARTDAEGHVVHIDRSTFLLRRGIRLDPGSRYRVTAVYDNPTGDTIRGEGMGTVGGIFLGPRGVTWPAADPTDPLYMADLASHLAHGHGDPGMALDAAGAGHHHQDDP